MRALAVVVLLVAAGCAGASTDEVKAAPAPLASPAATSAATGPTATGAANPTTDRASEVQRCIVRFHGKGGSGGKTTVSNGIKDIKPTGNAPGWNGSQWLYYPNDSYTQVRDQVAQAIRTEGCSRVVLYGFSNGASFAAKLVCQGERFGNTVIGAVIDDPVVDRGVEGCNASGVKLKLYWTGDINVPPGWDCQAADWTCEGGRAIGIDAYEKALGTARTPSIHKSHRAYDDAPELNNWW